MKKLSLSFLSALLIPFLFSCSDENDNPPAADLNAPEIGFAEGRDSFRPMEGEVRSASTDHMHVRFSVSDDSGIGQVLVDIHNSFDGHTHGRLNNTFTALNVKDIYSPDASQPFLRFPEGATFLNVDGSATDIYWEGPTSRVENNVLAGPYDIIISAVDVNGNQTSFGDDSNYLATFYIERPYAPMISVTNLHDGEIEGDAGEALEVVGSVAKAGHELSSEITFLWVRLVEEDHDHDHNHRVSGEEFYEKVWGTSAWRDGMSGPDLPNGEELKFEDIFTGDNAIILPEGEDHLDLIIWAEDANGNITRKVYEVHID
ncbi:hypothetical protein A33Q_1272 [Indibacter alkaliphilus LW1]|uniref:DUF4625 domain-containing protein n=1 Tax=Indibacter alkaliphilus (strain CCUG 57479 / KCTC 22604 / LW1) TaxID=1189612 RepID=S2E8K8_INDAL|nr:DUF4625 domain-containing protein [Indibacter alkaliphilus]EOZ98618.1 hypothetical protein A33Q_1272 [Indibacter alkaliphilus LW1]